MKDLTWPEKYISGEISAHCAMADGRSVIVACTERASKKYARLFSGDLPGNVVLLPISDVKSIISEQPSVIAVVGESLEDAREAYTALDSIKETGIPIVFCLPERRITRSSPYWQTSGIQYEGMFFLAGQYIRSLRPRGAYCEFGVFDGRTFAMAAHAMRGHCTHFYAFDSYRGISGSTLGEQSHFHDGDYRASVQTLLYNMKFSGVSERDFTIKAGFFEETLAGKTSEDDGIGPIAMAHIDVDVYLPAKLALDYIGDALIDGSLLLFDDYDQIGARNDMGERRALSEWLAENPHITVEPHRNYGVFCRSFIVHK